MPRRKRRIENEPDPRHYTIPQVETVSKTWRTGESVRTVVDTDETIIRLKDHDQIMICRTDGMNDPEAFEITCDFDKLMDALKVHAAKMKVLDKQGDDIDAEERAESAGQALRFSEVRDSTKW